mmetsp:Transcript_98093/g.184470  ORF Transcript_98093/g.184470 Transcript_98093/m.184470 type:complete len:600 (-) Transcript_98093:177-1976(-)
MQTASVALACLACLVPARRVITKLERSKGDLGAEYQMCREATQAAAHDCLEMLAHVLAAKNLSAAFQHPRQVGLDVRKGSPACWRRLRCGGRPGNHVVSRRCHSLPWMCSWELDLDTADMEWKQMNQQTEFQWHGGVEEWDQLPPMSREGGSEGEFAAYWRNSKPEHLPGGWVKFLSHPQVNACPYLYHPETGTISWQKPDKLSEGSEHAEAAKENEMKDQQSSLSEMTVKELRELLGTHGEVERQGYSWDDVAQRACEEYQQPKFFPRVQSFHDFKDITPWTFFDKKKGKTFGKGRDKGADFAEKAFFKTMAPIVMDRLYSIHPISIVYMMWAFTRARVFDRQLMQAVGDYLCDGRLPMLDRCGLGMGLRLFAEHGFYHKKLFDLGIAEIRRPMRCRSLAARNLQNLAFAFSKLKIRDEGVLEDLARQAIRLMKDHDPRNAKTDGSVLFPYICKDGYVEATDNFRIQSTPSLTWILECFLDLEAPRPILDKLVEAMADFALRSINRAPKYMLEPQDFVKFVFQLTRAVEMGCSAAVPGLEILAAPLRSFCQGLPDRELQRLAGMYKKAGVAWPEEAAEPTRVLVGAGRGGSQGRGGRR